jgi:hypothetical protein
MGQTTQASWEKPQNDRIADERLAKLQNRRGQRLQMLLGGGLLITAILILITNATALGQQYYISVEELLNKPEYSGQSVRITGAVIGDTIKETTVNGKTVIDFTVATIPIQTTNLADELSLAANNPDVNCWCMNHRQFWSVNSAKMASSTRPICSSNAQVGLRNVRRRWVRKTILAWSHSTAAYNLYVVRMIM